MYVYPSEMGFFIRENEALIREKTVIIAEDEDYEVTIGFGSDDLPEIAVYTGESLIERQTLISREDAILTCREIYTAYFSNDTEDGADDTDDDADHAEQEQEQEEVEDLIDSREDELMNALYDFIEIAAGSGDAAVTDGDEEVLLDEILALLADYGVRVYRPYIELDEEGEEVFEEYPYNVA